MGAARSSPEVTDKVERVLGRRPTDFDRWVQQTWFVSDLSSPLGDHDVMEANKRAFDQRWRNA